MNCVERPPFVVGMGTAMGILVAGAVLQSIDGSLAAEPPSLRAAAVTEGRLLLSLRPRYEHVAQEGKPYDANALTIRSLLGWQTGRVHDFSAMAQIIDVGRANDNYNDTKNGRTQFPVVADPDNTDLNQAYLDWSGAPDTRVRMGKQSIKLDNLRFVGNVEFRQIMQVFTGLTVENRSIRDVELYAGHLERIKTIVGDQQELRLDVLHVDYRWRAENRVVAYGYLHDSPKTASATGFADNSNRILGVRADGAWPLGGPSRLLYTAEIARQSSYAGGDPRIDAGYWHAGAGLGHGRFHVRIDQETLGSNDGLYGFQSPLGTNHLFQGWADLFLTTPATGVRDRYLTAGGPLLEGSWSAEYHDFRSDAGGIDYGLELDLGITWPLRKGLSGRIELAEFREGDVLADSTRKPDTRKLWLTLVYVFE